MRVDGATGDPFEGLPGVVGVSGTPYEAELALAPDADGNAILAALLRRGRVRRFEVRTPSLHEIFKRVAGDASPRNPREPPPPRRVREYLENVRTKAFLVAIFMTPLLMAASFVVPALLEQKPPEQRTIAVLDTTGVLGAEVGARVEARKAPDERTALYAVEPVPLAGADVAAREADQAARRDALDRRVLEGKLFGYLVIRPSALDRKPGQPPSEYRTGNLFDQKVFADLSTDLRDVANARLVAAGSVDPEVARVLTGRPPLTQGDVRAASKEAGIAQTAMPFVFMLLLFLTIVTVSQALVTNTIEEKSNRVIEVLLSSVSPFQLMAGKIVGTCARGPHVDVHLGRRGPLGPRDEGHLRRVRRPAGPVPRLLPAGLPVLRQLHGRHRERVQHAEGGAEPPRAGDGRADDVVHVRLRGDEGAERDPGPRPLARPALVPLHDDAADRVHAAAPTVGDRGVASGSSPSRSSSPCARPHASSASASSSYGKPPTLRELFRWMRSGA